MGKKERQVRIAGQESRSAKHRFDGEFQERLIGLRATCSLKTCRSVKMHDLLSGRVAPFSHYACAAAHFFVKSFVLLFFPAFRRALRFADSGPSRFGSPRW